MKKSVSLLCKMLAFASVASLALTSCGGDTGSSQTESSGTTTESSTTAEESSGSEEREHVTLEWYGNVNQTMPDMSMMTDEATRYIEEQLNTTVNFHLYDWGSYSTTVSTMINAGSDMDLVFAGGGISYVSYAQRDAFVPLNDYLETTLADTYASMPEAAWQAVTINGNVYGVPAQKDFGGRYNLEANQTLIDDVGVPFPDGEWNTAYDLIDWLYEFREAKDAKYPDQANVPLVSAMDIGPFYYMDEYTCGVGSNIPGLAGYEGMGDGETVFCKYLTDEYRQSMKTVRQLVVDGILPAEDNYDPDQVHKQNGEFVGWFGSGLVYLDETVNEPYYSTKLYVNNVVTTTTGSYTVGPMCISVQCEYPERAAEVLELVNNDQYLATTLRYGVEGEHWTDENNDNIIEDGPRNADTANRGWYTWYGWQFGGLFVSKVPAGNPSNFMELLTDLNDSANFEANIGFSVDTTNIVNEIAACSNSISEYGTTLSKGQNDNIDEMIDQFVADLEANGIQKIIDEVQSQLNTWRASVGKTVKE